MPGPMTLKIDVSPDVGTSIDALFDAAHRFHEFGHVLVDFLDGRVERLDAERYWLLTSRTVDGGVLLEPSQFLLELASAARAGEVDLLISKIHGSPRE